jgi:DNA-binding transcriptional LysR family regulator
MHEYSYRDPSAGLSDGTSDIAIVRLPIGLEHIWTAVLFSEPRVVAVAANHPLACRERVTVTELRGERMTRGVSEDPEFRRFWALVPESHAPVIETTSLSEELEVVATGQACCVNLASAARFAPHREVRFIQIDGVPRATTVNLARCHSPFQERCHRAPA